MYNEFMKLLLLDYNVCLGWMFVVCGSIFHVLVPLARVKKTRLLQCVTFLYIGMKCIFINSPTDQNIYQFIHAVYLFCQKTI